MAHLAESSSTLDTHLAMDLASLRRDLAWASSELAYVAHSMVGERSDMLSDLLLNICLALRKDNETLGRYLARPAPGPDASAR